MIELILKLNLILLSVTIGFGGLVTVIGKRLWNRYSRLDQPSSEIAENFLVFSLKGFITVYLILMFLIAVSLPLLTILSADFFRDIPGELPYAILAIMTIISIGSIVAYVAAFRRQNKSNKKSYLSADFGSEPNLYNLVLTLAIQFNVEDINNIRITPGSEIKIYEPVMTFDDVYIAGEKIVEIGLSSLELLSAADLRVLLARQFAYYAESSDPPFAFIDRLKRRFRLMKDNIIGGGFFLMLNPVSWLCLAAESIIDYITSDYQIMVEFKADQLVAHYSGSNRLSHALARYGVETELYRELIEIVNSQARGKGTFFTGNIFDSMRKAQTETTDQLKMMINHLFSDDASAGGDVGKKTLKLRLRRLPEAPEIPGLEIKRPALAYLKDWRLTENHMLKLLQG